MDRDGIPESECASDVLQRAAERDEWGAANGYDRGDERAGGAIGDGGRSRVHDAVQLSVDGWDGAFGWGAGDDAGGSGGDAVCVWELVGWRGGDAQHHGAGGSGELHGELRGAVFSDDGGGASGGRNDSAGDRVVQQRDVSCSECDGGERIHVRWV